MNEAQFIAALRMLPLHPGADNLTDDAAIITLGEDVLIITHDMMVEGRHYLPTQHMGDVAWKLVATNLSDLAAKGADPLGVILGHMLGDGDADFLAGLDDVLNHYGVPLLGGDTVSSAANTARSFGLTALGRASHMPAPRRSGACNGDAVFVTGILGAAMLGFEALRDDTDADTTAYTRPLARVMEGRYLAPLAHAMMDVSDGLLLDAFRMAEASECTIALDSSAAPLADPARVMDCLTWGDDYELLFTLPENVTPPVPATRIGHIAPRGFAPLIIDGEPILNPHGLGYLHE